MAGSPARRARSSPPRGSPSAGASRRARPEAAPSRAPRPAGAPRRPTRARPRRGTRGGSSSCAPILAGVKDPPADCPLKGGKVDAYADHGIPAGRRIGLRKRLRKSVGAAHHASVLRERRARTLRGGGADARRPKGREREGRAVYEVVRWADRERIEEPPEAGLLRSALQGALPRREEVLPSVRRRRLHRLQGRRKHALLRRLSGHAVGNLGRIPHHVREYEYL